MQDLSNEWSSDLLESSLDDINFDIIIDNNKKPALEPTKSLFSCYGFYDFKNENFTSRTQAVSFPKVPSGTMKGNKPKRPAKHVFSTTLYHPSEFTSKTFSTSAECSIDKEIEKITRELNLLSQNRAEKFMAPQATRNKLLNVLKSPKRITMHSLHRGSMANLEKPKKVEIKKTNPALMGWESPRNIEIRVLCEIIAKLEKEIEEKSSALNAGQQRLQSENKKHQILLKKYQGLMNSTKCSKE